MIAIIYTGIISEVKPTSRANVAINSLVVKEDTESALSACPPEDFRFSGHSSSPEGRQTVPMIFSVSTILHTFAYAIGMFLPSDSGVRKISGIAKCFTGFYLVFLSKSTCGT